MRDLREKAGLTLQQVACKIRVSVPYLSDMERGNRAFNAKRIRQVESITNTHNKRQPVE